MSSPDPLRIFCVVPSSSVTGSACLFDEISGREYLVLAISRTITVHRLEIPREPVFSVNLEGNITSLVPLRDRSALFVTFDNQGSHRYMILSGVPNLAQTYRSSSPFVQGYGEGVDHAVVSNEYDGLIVYQFQEGSIHVVSDLNGVEPQITVLHLTRHSPILPIRSMVLVPRGSDHYGLITVVGDDDMNTELRGYNLHLEGKNVSIERVSNLPPNLAKLALDVKPYKVYFDSIMTRSVAFIGGDSKSFSAVQILSIDEVFSTGITRRSFVHCQPLPAPEIVGAAQGLLVCNSFGEMYSINTDSGKVSLVSDSTPGSVSGVSSMIWFEKQQKLFISSVHGDSVLFDPRDNSIIAVTTCTAPVLGISCSTADRVITTVSGAGASASLNRIMTTGVGAGTRLEKCGDITATHRLLLGLNDSILICSNAIHSLIFRIEISGDHLKLTEDSSRQLPPCIEGVYDLESSGSLCVTEDGVYLVSETGSIRKTWSAPQGSKIVANGYCGSSKVLVVVAGDNVHVLTDSGSIERKLPGVSEISCVGVHENFLAVGTWSGKCFVLEGDTDTRVFKTNSIPRSIIVGPAPDSLTGPRSIGSSLCCFVGGSDGSVTVLKINSGEPFTRNIGILPVSLGFAEIGPEKKRIVIASGDRPCVISSEGSGYAFTELVDSSRGTVVTMNGIQISKKSGLIFSTDSDNLIQCFWASPASLQSNDCYHVQRASLADPSQTDCVPVGVEVIDNVIAAGVCCLSEGSDQVAFFDSIQLSKLSTYILPRGEQIVCISKFRGGLLVGSAVEVPDRPSEEPSEGRIRYLVTDEGDSWTESVCHTVLRSDGSFAGAIYGISVLDEEFVAVIAVRTMYILKISGGHFAHVASADTDFLAVSLASHEVSGGHRIVVGDVSKSCRVFSFTKEDFSLYLVGQDLIPASTMATDFVGSKYVVLGDDLGNVYAMESVEPSLRRLERVSGINVGQSSITAMARADKDSLWIGTRDGSLSLLTMGEIRQPSLPTGQSIFSGVIEPLRANHASVGHRIAISSMDISAPSTDVVGGEYFVRALQEFTRSSERKIAELTFENSELESKIVQLEHIIDAKDNVIKEYLRRVALLEYALKKDRFGKNASLVVVPPAPTVGEPIPARRPVKIGPSCREILMKYLDEVGELTMPSASEIAATQNISGDPPKGLFTKVDEYSEEEDAVSGIATPKLVAKLSCSLTKSRKIAIGPIGSLVVGSDDGLVRIWTDPHSVKEADLRTAASNANTANPNLVLRGTGFPVSALVCTDSHVVVGDTEGHLTVFRISQLGSLELFPNTVDLDAATSRHHIMAAHSSVCALAVHPGARLIASSGSEGTVKLWKSDDASEQFLKFADMAYACGSQRSVLLWHQTNSNQLINGLADGIIQTIDVASGEVTTRASHGASEILALVAVSDTVICMSQADGGVRLVDSNSFTTVKKIEAPRIGITCQSLVMGRENRIISGWSDGCLRLLAGDDLRILTSIDAHAHIGTEGALGMAWTESMAVSAGADGRVCIFNSLW